MTTQSLIGIVIIFIWIFLGIFNIIDSIQFLIGFIAFGLGMGLVLWENKKEIQDRSKK